MSTDNLNKKPDVPNDEELTQILKRLSELLDKSVSLEEAVALVKQQPTKAEPDTAESETAPDRETVTEETPVIEAVVAAEEASADEKVEIPENQPVEEAVTQEETAVEAVPAEETVATVEAEAAEPAPAKVTAPVEEAPAEETKNEEEEEVDAYVELIRKLHAATETASVQSRAYHTEKEPEPTAEAPAAEAEPSDKNMPVSNFIKLLKSKHFKNSEEIEESIVTLEAVPAEEIPAESENDTAAEPAEESIPVSDEAVTDEETTVEEAATEESEEKIITDEEPIVTEKVAEPEEVPAVFAPEDREEVPVTPEEVIIDEPSAEEIVEVAEAVKPQPAIEEKTEPRPAEEEAVTEAEPASSTPTPSADEEDLDFSTSKIFDELLACFEGHKLPEDFRFSEYNATKEPEATQEEPEEKTEEISEPEEEPAVFVPIDHEAPNKDDELFAEVFSDEKSDRQNKERDKKKWQAQNGDANPFLSGLFDWLEIITMSAAFALLLFTFIVRLAVVDGDSMNQTFHNGELLIISELMYTPENNDVVVFTSPNYPNPIIKRIIATEGQTVDIDFETWTVTVDGRVIDEPYVNRTVGAMEDSDMQFPLTVPDGHVFVMGDNRNESLDSRNSRIGFVDERNILGEVKLRVTPFDKFGKVN